jgi:AraC-like DNA-binding protein
MRVVLNESDVYREFAPPVWARGAIACFWVRRGDGGSVRVLPDACSLTLRRVVDAAPDAAVQAAVVRLRDPRTRVDELAASLGSSERQLPRRFLAAVGYGPKTLQRVLRRRRFLASVQEGAVGLPGGPRCVLDDLAGAALTAGYADQAHLARECRALTGLAPAQLARTAGTPTSVV